MYPTTNIAPNRPLERLRKGRRRLAWLATALAFALGLSAPAAPQGGLEANAVDLQLVLAIAGLLERQREVSLLLSHDRSTDLLECTVRSREIVIGLPELAREPAGGLTAASELVGVEVADRALQGGDLITQ